MSEYQRDLSKVVAEHRVIHEALDDISNPKGPVEISWGQTPIGKTLWVNINGVCVFRVCGIKELKVEYATTK